MGHCITCCFENIWPIRKPQSPTWRGKTTLQNVEIKTHFYWNNDRRVDGLYLCRNTNLFRQDSETIQLYFFRQIDTLGPNMPVYSLWMPSAASLILSAVLWCTLRLALGCEHTKWVSNIWIRKGRERECCTKFWSQKGK